MEGNKNFISPLHEYVQKTNSKLLFEDLGSVGPDHDKVFSCRFILDDHVCLDGVGRNKKQAKNNAAENALKYISERKYVSDETRKQSGTSKDNSLPEKCLTGTVSQGSHKRLHDDIAEKRCNEPNNSQLFCKPLINSKEYAMVEDENVKKAKPNTSQLACTAPQQHSHSKVFRSSTDFEDDAAMSSLPTESTMLFSNESSQTTSDSIVFADSSNPLKAQASSLSSMSENNALADLSTSSSLESIEPPSHNMETGENGSHSVIFMDSSNPDKDQVAMNNSAGNGASNTSTQSRFTSEFDSITRLGKGGFARVYKAREKLMNKYYAVKVVQFKEKALREATALSDLHHPNIVRYFNCWKEDTEYQDESSVESCSFSQSISHSSPMYLYIKMELCDTKTLKNWIKERNEKTLQDSKRREESLNIAQQIVSGVEYIHVKKLIHRDLKPPNIMFGQNKEVKIGDFGLVTAEADDNDKNLMERTRKTGTVSYMAPEQHGQIYDQKVDIFSLGLIYLELLWKVSTGSERVFVLMDAKQKKFPTQFKSDFLQEYHIIRSMLHEKPEHRPEAVTLKTELERLSLTLSAPKKCSWKGLTDRTR